MSNTRNPFEAVPVPRATIDAYLIGGPCAGLRPIVPDNEVVCYDIKTSQRAAYRRSTGEFLDAHPGVVAYRFAGMRR